MNDNERDLWRNYLAARLGTARMEVEQAYQLYMRLQASSAAISEGRLIETRSQWQLADARLTELTALAALVAVIPLERLTISAGG